MPSKKDTQWKGSRDTDAYAAAQILAFNIKEYAKSLNIHPKSVKVYDKEAIYRTHVKADAAVEWKEGPDGWQAMIDDEHTFGVSVRIDYENSLVLFYDN